MERHYESEAEKLQRLERELAAMRGHLREANVAAARSASEAENLRVERDSILDNVRLLRQWADSHRQRILPWRPWLGGYVECAADVYRQLAWLDKHGGDK